MPDANDYSSLKLQIGGLLGPGEQHKRGLLLDSIYAFLPKDPEAKVLVFTAEIAPLGYTNWHCHNGATFFVATQGLFEAHFQEGTLVSAKPGDVYSEPIGNTTAGITRIPS
jgi:quercetin dioxygenase-like cupin family protein